MVARQGVRRPAPDHRRLHWTSRAGGGELTRPVTVGLVADYREEGWPSMDLVADMIERHVPAVSGGTVSIVALRAPFVRRLPSRSESPNSVERVVNRFWDYPRWLRRH